MMFRDQLSSWGAHRPKRVASSTEGQIKSKAESRTLDSTQKWTNEFVFFFAVKSKKEKETNLFFRFLGESTVRKSAYVFIWP